MSEAHADPEIPGGHEVQPGTGLSTSVLKQLMQLVLGDARDAVEVAKAAHGRGHLPVVGIQSAKAEARDAEILEKRRREGNARLVCLLLAPLPSLPKDRRLGLTLLAPQITWVLLGSGKLERKESR